MVFFGMLAFASEMESCCGRAPPASATHIAAEYMIGPPWAATAVVATCADKCACTMPACSDGSGAPGICTHTLGAEHSFPEP